MAASERPPYGSYEHASRSVSANQLLSSRQRCLAVGATPPERIAACADALIPGIDAFA
jgi:hypothetical protein